MLTPTQESRGAAALQLNPQSQHFPFGIALPGFDTGTANSPLHLVWFLFSAYQDSATPQGSL